MLQTGAKLIVAHLQHEGGRPSAVELRRMKSELRFEGYPDEELTHVYGKGEEYESYASVVGMRSAGTWSFYAQNFTNVVDPMLTAANQFL